MKQQSKIGRNSRTTILTTKPCETQAAIEKAALRRFWRTNLIFHRRKPEILGQPETLIVSVNRPQKNDLYLLRISIGQILIQRFEKLPSMLFEPLSFTEQEFDCNAILLEVEEFIDRIYWVGGLR